MLSVIEELGVGVTSVAGLIGDISVAEVCFERERFLQDKLADKNIGCYVPLRREQKVWGGRRRTVWLPAFPGYAFVAGGDAGIDAATAICDQRGRVVWNLLEWGRSADGKFSESFQRALRADLLRVEELLATRPDTAYPELLEGMLVEIIGGAFRGKLGVIETRERIDEFTVRTDVMGDSRPLGISPDKLRPVMN